MAYLNALFHVDKSLFREPRRPTANMDPKPINTLAHWIEEDPHGSAKTVDGDFTLNAR